MFTRKTRVTLLVKCDWRGWTVYADGRAVSSPQASVTAALAYRRRYADGIDCPSKNA